MKTPHHRNKTLITLAILAGTSAVVSLPAEAGRFGGGRSFGLGRAASTHHSAPHEATHLSDAPASTAHPAYEVPAPGYVLRHPPLDLPAQPAIRSNSADDISFARSANALLRQSRLDDLRFQRMLAKQHSRYAEPQPTPAVYAETTTAGNSSLRQPPAEPVTHVLDPRFSRLTEAAATPETRCEIKPVMSDADYVACGATPPQFPSLR